MGGDKRLSVNRPTESGIRNGHQVEDNAEKLKYPKSVFFIVSNEFCERFSYYGMRTILALYLTDKLLYTKDDATVVYHVFTMFVYFFPLFGAMLADSLLGKFRTIFYLSIIYAAGQLLLSATAVPTFGIPLREFSLLGLLLIAVGTGGIKPCVAAFGGDQFVLPQQERYLAMFFSVFYFAINSGSLVSSFLTPELRQRVKCFDELECYSLAFFVPAVLMVVSIVVFVLGRPLYTVKKPQGNIIVNVVKCITHAIRNKSSKKLSRDHWLDHADDKYERKLIDDIKAVLQVLTLFIPLPVFWALFDQQGSRWTFQAQRMDGAIGSSYLIKPDQMQVLNPLFIVICIPVFESWIYPLLAKIRFIDTPLKKLTVGGFLAALAFIVSALVEFQLEKTYPVLPSQGLGQLRIFNSEPCNITGTIGGDTIVNVEPFGMWVKKDLVVDDEELIDYEMSFGHCQGMATGKQIGTFSIHENQATSYMLASDRAAFGFKDVVNKSENGYPVVRGLVYYENFANDSITLAIKNPSTSIKLKIDGPMVNTELLTLDPSTYDVSLNGKSGGKFALKLGGVYTILGRVNGNDTSVKLIAVTEPNSIHMLWLVPQYVLITFGEVMFSVTGLQFAFTQAPVSMKSLLQAAWLLTVAFGNLIVAVIAEFKFFDSQAEEFLLFAGLMIIDMIIFAVMATYYKYVEPENTETEETDINLANNGRTND